MLTHLKSGESQYPPQIVIGLRWSSVTRKPLTLSIIGSAVLEYLEVVGFETLSWKALMRDISDDRLFLGRVEAWRDFRGMERLRTIEAGLEYDHNLSGWWIKRNSTAHSLANILGFTLYDPNKNNLVK